MKFKFLLAFLITAYFLLPSGARADKKRAAAPLSWGYVKRGTNLEAKPGSRKPAILKLGRGALVTILEEKSQGATPWARIRAIDPAALEAVIGWVDSSVIEIEPFGQYPSDAELLKQLGGAYLEDLEASSAQIVRYVMAQGRRGPALVCFIGTRVLPQTRLQIFQSSNGKFNPGPYLEFPSSEIQSAITSLEVIDLASDGNDCLLTHEPFKFQTRYDGVNMVIRKIEDDTLKTLWQAPLEFRNLASFPPNPQKLDPPENNIGTPGTITSGTVEFRARGHMNEPVWKGKIAFYIPGREEPLDTVTFEKLCPWDGSKFAPVP
jgi:hypothetical protein